MQPAGDPGHIVIAHKGQGREAFQQGVVAVERGNEFVVVCVVEGTPDSFPGVVYPTWFCHGQGPFFRGTLSIHFAPRP
jgi:urocanate hydratase